MKKILVVGAGGFAREVAWLIREIDEGHAQFEFGGYVVSDVSAAGEHDSRDEIAGDFAWLEQNAGRYDALAFGIGNPQVKLRLGEELTRRVPDLEWPVLIHPNVRMDHRSCSFGRGVVICAGVIGTVNIRYDDFAMLNLACTVGHESVIGAAAVLNPTVNISGGVVIDRGVLIGTGAQILQYKKVGAGATIGAGAVVVKDVPPGDTVAGVPAKSMNKA